MLFSFNSAGRGEATIIEPNDQCKGDASARMDGNVLHIEMQELNCARQQTAYGKANISCSNSAGNHTVCSGQNFDGTMWDATFLRLR